MNESLEIAKYRFDILVFDNSQIDLGKYLAGGGFGDVYYGKVIETTRCVIKTLKEFNPLVFWKEANFLQKYRHPFLPRQFGTWDNSDNPKEINLSLVNELIKGKSLQEFKADLNYCSDLDKMIICYNISTIINYLHGYNVIHRDLKPQNIMCTEAGVIKLLDFGISKAASHTETITHSLAGTVTYMAPEQFDIGVVTQQTYKGLPNVYLTTRVDIWSFGCIINEIFSGKKPWSKGNLDDNNIKAQLSKGAEFPVEEDLISDKRIVGLIKNMTMVNVDHRWDIIRVRGYLMNLILSKIKAGEHLKKSFDYLKPKKNQAPINYNRLSKIYVFKETRL